MGVSLCAALHLSVARSEHRFIDNFDEGVNCADAPRSQPFLDALPGTVVRISIGGWVGGG